MRVSSGGKHFEYPVVKLENRDIEGAAAQIVNRNRAFLALVQTIGERGSGRLIHQSQHPEASNAAGVLRRLPLRIVEVRGHGNHGLLYFLAQTRCGVLVDQAQNECRDVGRGEGAVGGGEMQYLGSYAGHAERKKVEFVSD